MRVIRSSRCLLVLLALFGVLSESLGEETNADSGATVEGENPEADAEAEATDDDFELNELMPGLEDPNKNSFIENYIMGEPEFYREAFDPVS